MPMRCRSPPLKAWGYRRMYSGRSPTCRKRSATRSSRSRRLIHPYTSSGSPTRSSRVMRGLREMNGSWKIICISRRRARSSEGRSWPISITEPSLTRMKISPLVGSIARSMQRAVVVFPQPLSPTRPSVSPSSMWKSTPSTARTCPTVRFQKPLRMGKCFCSPATRSKTWGEREVNSSLIEEAAHGVLISHASQARGLPVARPRHEFRTARMEGASRRPVIGMRHGARDRDQALSGARSNAGNRAQEGLGIGMPRGVEDLVDGGLLDHASQVHHRHVSGPLGADAQVMRDEHDGHPVFLLELTHEGKNLRLGGHIESRGRLIRDQQARIAGER